MNRGFLVFAQQGKLMITKLHGDQEAKRFF
jgi:hypothetical protein